MTQAQLALLAGAILIAVGGANFNELATKIGVGCVLYYVFTGKVFDIQN